MPETVSIEGLNKDGKLVRVRVIGDRLAINSESPAFAAAKERGDCYIMTNLDATAAAGTYTIYVRNDDKRDLVLHSLRVGSTVTVRLILTTVTGTAGGATAATPVNLNTAFADVANVLFFSTADTPVTGLTPVSTLALARCVATDDVEVLPGPGLIRVKQGVAIALEIDIAATADVLHTALVAYFDEAV